MILMRSGKTGSGKSFDAIHTAYAFWHDGMDIWSNTPLLFTKFNNGKAGENIIDNPKFFSIRERLAEKIRHILRSKPFYFDLPVKCRGRIRYFETLDEIFHIKEAVIIFDEGQTVFRNYDWESVPRMFLHKLEQNRKHGLHLITTAQRVKAVNVNYRALIQEWRHFETRLDFWGFHLYRMKIKDCDFADENIAESDVPDEKVRNWKLITPWTKRIYDTMFDIGFEPLQEYSLNYNGERVGLILESGLTVKRALQDIKMMQGVFNINMIPYAKRKLA